MSQQTRLAERAQALRAAFDRSFAEAPLGAPEADHDLLAIRIAGDAYAIRLAEVAGVYADRRIVALPSAVLECLGIVGFRGSICPVYELGALLGYPPARACRWVLLARGAQTVGLAFPELEAHLRVRRNLLGAEADQGRSRQHVRGVVSVGDALRPIVDLPSIVEAIKQRVLSVGPRKEQ
jgi:chemotaxis signal transduction protein